MARKTNSNTGQNNDAKPPTETTADAEQIRRALRAFTMYGRPASEVLRLNERETIAFARLVTKDLEPANEKFGEQFSKQWTAHRLRLFSPAKESKQKPKK